MPSKDEWRCAERGRVIWCAGGETAAGVPAQRGHELFHCGPRWGSAEKERVCVDFAPEYPRDTSVGHCKFEQELGLTRVCKREGEDTITSPLPRDGIASCWLDRDCASNGCDRGVCRCEGSEQCTSGTCRAGHCVGASP